MNYIYDILVNFCERPYEFYDWNLDDEIEHIRKIPLFKVSNLALKELKGYQFSIEETLMEKLKYKAEVFERKGVEQIPYACLFSDGMEVVGIEFNNQGVSIAKTKLLIDEEMEVLEVANRLQETDIKYSLIKEEVMEHFKTRKEEEISKYINQELELLEKKQVEKLQYLYYECFNKKENNISKIMKIVKDELSNNFNLIYPQVYEFFKLTDVKK